MPLPRRPRQFYNDLQLGLFDDIGEDPAIERAARELGAQRRAEARLASGDGEMLFMSFGSGSSGNCAYLGDSDGGFLIDAGVDADRVTEVLRRNAIDMTSVKGIILTHDHSDHVRAVYPLLRQNRHMGVYCTPRTLTGLLRRHNISRRIKDYHRPIYKEFEFKIGNFAITPFEVSHDGTDNVGYYIIRGRQAFAVATDLGCITERVEYYMSRADHIVIESNYDLRMLEEGRYHEYLKHRIKADDGHLDNRVASAFIARIITPRLRHLFLCHLSADNNRPDVAVAAMREALSGAGYTDVGDFSGSVATRELPLQLMALPRFDPTPLFVLRPGPQGL